VQGELAALADARPRNLYLFGLFVADHQLPEPEALPAPPESAAVPEPSQPAAIAAVPAAVPLPAAPAAASAAVLPDEQPLAGPSVPLPPPPLPPPASAADGGDTDMASLTVPPLDVSMASAVAQQPGSTAASQAGSGAAKPGGTRLGSEDPLPDPPALPIILPPPADSPPRVGKGATPASAAPEHVDLAAAAVQARKLSRWSGSDRSTPERGPAAAPQQQTQVSPTDRQMTRWGKEPTRWGKEPPSPLKANNSWKGRLVNIAATEDTVFSVRPAQHGKLTSSETAPARSPVAQQKPAEPTAGTPAQRAEVKLEPDAPLGDAAAAPAVGAEEVPLQAASGTAPEESQRSSDWEAALVSGKAPWRSAADAAGAEAEAATVSKEPADTASADGAKHTSKNHRRRSDPSRALRKSRSRDESRTRRSPERRTTEPGQPVEQRNDTSRGRRSPERCADRPSDRRQPTEGRREDHKRQRLEPRSAERRKGRHGRESSAERLERDLGRWGDSRDRQVRSCGRPDPIGRRSGSDRWGPITAFRSDRHGLVSKDQAAALPPPPGSMAPAASMASMLILTTEPEERARLLASALGQVQQSGNQTPAPHAAAVSEEGDECELPPLPDSPLVSQGLPAQAGASQGVAGAPEAVEIVAAEAASHAQHVAGEAHAAGASTPSAEHAGAEPPLPLGAVTAAAREQLNAPATGDEAPVMSSGRPHEPALQAGPAQMEATIYEQPIGTDGMHQPAKSDRVAGRRRWDAVESAGRHDDGIQRKRQREGSHGNAQERMSSADVSLPAQQQHSEAYLAACSLLEQGYNPLRTQAGCGPARQSYKTQLCIVGDKCPWPSDCDGAHAESELLSREQITALCELAREWRRHGVPCGWRHLVQRPSYDPFSRQSQSPPPQPASEQTRPPSESPPPLPVESACDGLPSPEFRLPPPSGDYTAWRAVKQEPPMPSYNPYGSPSPHSSAEGDEQPRNSPGIPYGGEASPLTEPPLPPPPPLPPSVSPPHQQERLLDRPGSLDDSHDRPGVSPWSAVHGQLASQPDSPLDSHSLGRLPQHGDYAKPPAQPDSPTPSPALPAFVQEAGEQTPPPLPPAELRDMPPLGSAKKVQQAAQMHAGAQAEPAEAAIAHSSEGATPRAAGLYAATERARPLLATGIDPLRWHAHAYADTSFVRKIRTKLCPGGNACATRLSNCAYAHGPRELLTRDDNTLLVEVATEWQSHGIPAEWKHVVKRQAASHGNPPAARTVVVAQRRSKDVSPMPPPPHRSRDTHPKAPPAVRSQPDLQRHEGRRPASTRRQQLPHSMLNEDLEIEDSLMHLITVRLSRSLGACTFVELCYMSHYSCLEPYQCQ